MALINCPECGHQISDNAKNCPNCGFSLKSKHSFFKPQFSQYLSLRMGIALVLFICSLITVFVGIGWMTNFSMNEIKFENNFSIGIILFLVSFIPLYVSCLLLKNKVPHYNRIFFISGGVYIFFLITIFLSLGWNTETEEEYYARVGLNTHNNNSQKEENSPLNYLGTYEYIQPDNNSRAEKLIITLNEDETAVVKSFIKGKEKTYYGSWDEFNNGSIKLSFSDAYFTWDGRTTNLLDAWINWGEAINVDGSVIKDGYLYANLDMAKAKNPEYRVKLEKIN